MGVFIGVFMGVFMGVFPGAFGGFRCKATQSHAHWKHTLFRSPDLTSHFREILPDEVRISCPGDLSFGEGGLWSKEGKMGK